MKKYNVFNDKKYLCFISIVLDVIAFIAFGLIYSFSNALKFFFVISLFASLISFFDFSKWIISIFRRKRKDLRKLSEKIDYNEVPKENVMAVKSLKGYEKDYLLGIKLKSDSVCQIVKDKDRIIIYEFDDTQNNISLFEADITEKDNTCVKTQILHKDIKSISLSRNNSKEHIVLTIKSKNRTYRLIGFIEELDENVVIDFFKNIKKVKIIKQTVKKESMQKANSIYNLLLILNYAVTPYSALLLFEDFNGLQKITQTITAFVGLSILFILLCLPIAFSKYFKFEIFSKEERKDGRKEVGIVLILFSSLLLLKVFARLAIFNLIWTTTVIAIVLCLMFTLYMVNYNIKSVEYLIALAVVLIIIITPLLLGFNSLITLNNESYNVVVQDKHISTQVKGPDDYYFVISVAGRTINLPIDYETYENSPSTVNVKMTKGILGIEYVSMDF